jgi:tetratricopeptide (TPR) repeat protein
MVSVFRFFVSGLVWVASFTPAWLLCQPQPSSEQAIVAHFRAGQQAMKGGQFELAVTEFSKVLRLSPNLVQAQVNLGLAHHLLGQYGESVAVLARAAQQKPELAPAHLFLGLGYLKLGSHQKALVPLERAVRLEPANREARRSLAACRLAEGDYRQAAREFRELFALEPDKTEAWFQLGRNYTDAASRLVQRMSLDHRRTAWGHRLAGDLYSQSQRWELAAQEYREAITIDSAQPGLHASLGNVHLHQGKLAEGSSEFHNELQRDPNNEEALLGLAKVHLVDGNVGAAREPVEQLLKNSPEFLALRSDFLEMILEPSKAQGLIADLRSTSTDVPFHFLLSALFRITGETAEARAHEATLLRLTKEKEQERPATVHEGPEQLCQARRYAACAQALASKPKLDAAGYLLLGRARLALRQVEAASDAFAAALPLSTVSTEVIYRVARSYQVLADECFNRVEEVAPESWRMHQIRAETYKLRYEDKQAIREYELAAQLRPDRPELYEGLGALYLTNNSLDEARVALERALNLEPSRARALYLLGQLYVTGREQEKAIPYLQKALRFDANLLEAHATLGKAYLRSGRPEAAVIELEKSLSLDFYGDLHYLLYQAYRDLGKAEPARAALRRSEEMRKNSVDRDRDKLERWSNKD